MIVYTETDVESRRGYLHVIMCRTLATVYVYIHVFMCQNLVEGDLKEVWLDHIVVVFSLSDIPACFNKSFIVPLQRF